MVDGIGWSGDRPVGPEAVVNRSICHLTKVASAAGRRISCGSC